MRKNVHWEINFTHYASYLVGILNCDRYFYIRLSSESNKDSESNHKYVHFLIEELSYNWKRGTSLYGK